MRLVTGLFTLMAVCCLNFVSANEMPELPDEFYVKERWLSLTRTFDIETKQYQLGTVHRKFWSFSPNYEFRDTKDFLHANAVMRFWSFGAIFDVYDRNNGIIGKVEEKVFTWFPTFEIISPEGEKLAEAKMNFWHTKYTVKDPVTSQEFAVLSRSFFRLKDDWTAKLTNRELFAQKRVDPRLFVVVMAFQTDLDYWKNVETETVIACSFRALPSSKMILAKARGELDKARQTLVAIEPSQADFALVESLLEEQEACLIASNEEQAADEAFSKAFELLNDESLSDGQRTALFLIIEDKVEPKQE